MTKYTYKIGSIRLNCKNSEGTKCLQKLIFLKHQHLQFNLQVQNITTEKNKQWRIQHTCAAKCGSFWHLVAIFAHKIPVHEMSLLTSLQ